MSGLVRHFHFNAPLTMAFEIQVSLKKPLVLNLPVPPKGKFEIQRLTKH